MVISRFGPVDEMVKVPVLSRPYLRVRVPPGSPLRGSDVIGNISVSKTVYLCSNRSSLANGSVVKLANTQDLKSCDRKVLSVQVRPEPPAVIYDCNKFFDVDFHV